MIFRATVVRKARRRAVCDACREPITGPHISLAGLAHDSQFAVSRVHGRCCGSRGDGQVKAAIEALKALGVPT